MRALNPNCSNDLRGRVDDVRTWTSPEWRQGNSKKPRKICEGSAVKSRSLDDSNADCSRDVNKVKLREKGSAKLRHYIRGSAELGAPAGGPPLATPATGMAEEASTVAPPGNGIGNVSSFDDVEGSRQRTISNWSYKIYGLGKMLAFDARRRSEAELHVENLEA